MASASCIGIFLQLSLLCKMLSSSRATTKEHKGKSFFDPFLNFWSVNFPSGTAVFWSRNKSYLPRYLGPLVQNQDLLDVRDPCLLLNQCKEPALLTMLTLHRDWQYTGYLWLTWVRDESKDHFWHPFQDGKSSPSRTAAEPRLEL